MNRCIGIDFVAIQGLMIHSLDYASPKLSATRLKAIRLSGERSNWN